MHIYTPIYMQIYTRIHMKHIAYCAHTTLSPLCPYIFETGICERSMRCVSCVRWVSCVYGSRRRDGSVRCVSRVHKYIYVYTWNPSSPRRLPLYTWLKMHVGIQHEDRHDLCLSSRILSENLRDTVTLERLRGRGSFKAYRAHVSLPERNTGKGLIQGRKGLVCSDLRDTMLI